MPTALQRARSREAKQAREQDILNAASEIATERGVRSVTLTDIAAEVGMHKSAMLRYFETREEIFLRLTGEAWQEWSRAARTDLARLASAPVDLDARLELIPAIAQALADSLVSRPLFCDLLAQAPLNLERNVSLESLRSFKLIALVAVASLVESLRHLLPLTEPHGRDIVATATCMAGALWQMAAPGTALRELYLRDPDLSHAIVDVGPRLTCILTGLMIGFTVTSTSAG
jgi:AcrR family transcriptional regulator